jgi:hypothetical protein
MTHWGVVTRRPKILYLDQNAWIALARGAWDKTEHPRDHAALTVVVEALEGDNIVAPLSFTTQYETMKVDNLMRRTHLANVQATISGGRVLRGRRRILEVMLSRCIADATGVQVPKVTGEWFLSDLWLETVADYASGAFGEAISPVALDHIRRHPKETLFDYLAGADEKTRKEGVRRFSAESQALLALMTARRERVAGEPFALRLRAYSAHLMIDEIDFILGLGRRLGLPWSSVSDIGDKLAKSLVTEVPVMNAERQLAARLEDQSRATTENDLRDMGAFVTALPLVDIVVAEKQFVNLSRQAKLDARYGTRLLTSIHDLTPAMLGSVHETS